MTFEEAKAHLGDAVQPNGDLDDGVWYLRWHASGGHAKLDGDFNADDLEAISVYMRHFRSL